MKIVKIWERESEVIKLSNFRELKMSVEAEKYFISFLIISLIFLVVSDEIFDKSCLNLNLDGITKRPFTLHKNSENSLNPSSSTIEKGRNDSAIHLTNRASPTF